MPTILPKSPPPDAIFVLRRHLVWDIWINIALVVSGCLVVVARPYMNEFDRCALLLQKRPGWLVF